MFRRLYTLANVRRLRCASAFVICAIAIFGLIVQSALTLSENVESWTVSEHTHAHTHTHAHALGEEFCFWYFSYRDDSAVQFSLSSLRQYAPSSVLLISSDHGDDFAETAQKFNASHVTVEPYSINLWDQRPPYNFTCGAYLDRLLAGARRCHHFGARFMVLWEEDARLMNALPAQPPFDVAYHANMEHEHNFCCHAGTVLNLDMVLRHFSEVGQRPAIANDGCSDPCLKKLTSALVNEYGATRGPWPQGVAQFRDCGWMKYAAIHVLPSTWLPALYEDEDLKSLRCLSCQLSWKQRCGCAGYYGCVCSSTEAQLCWWNRDCPDCPSIIHGFKRATFDCKVSISP